MCHISPEHIFISEPLRLKTHTCTRTHTYTQVNLSPRFKLWSSSGVSTLSLSGSFTLYLHVRMQRRMACHIVKTQLKPPLDVCVHTGFSDSICFLSYKPSLLISTCAFALFTSVRHLISWYIWVIEERHALIAAVMLWYFLFGGGSSFVAPFHLLLPSLFLSISPSVCIIQSLRCTRASTHTTPWRS